MTNSNNRSTSIFVGMAVEKRSSHYKGIALTAGQKRVVDQGNCILFSINCTRQKRENMC